MTITASILGLTKNNNGFFKSEKQADFLINQLNKSFGFIGISDSGYNSCPIFAKWDNEGIVELSKDSKSGRLVIFERKIEGKLTVIEEAQLKSNKRALKKLESKLSQKVSAFIDGSYNSTGDVTTYSEDMIARYLEVKKDLETQINTLKKIIYG